MQPSTIMAATRRALGSHFRFDPAPEKTSQAAADKSGTEPQADQRISVAATRVRDLARGAEHRDPNVILLTLAFLSQSLTLLFPPRA
jgi:hypothetical protein